MFINFFNVSKALDVSFSDTIKVISVKVETISIILILSQFKALVTT